MDENKRVFGVNEKDQARFDEEYDKKMRAANIAENTPAPGDFFPPPISTPDLGELRTKSTRQGQQLELKERGLEYYLAEWESKNRDYELTHLSQGAIIKSEREAHDLPIEFVDFLIDEASKSDMREDDHHLLFSILRNLDKIIIYNTASTIQIGLRDNERRLLRIFFESKPPFVLRKVE